MIYLNGALVSDEFVRISPDDRGFLLGDGVFETLPVYRGSPFLLREHMERLAQGAERLRIRFGLTFDEAASAINDLIETNRLAGVDGVVRITLSRGTGPRGLAIDPDAEPTLVITAREWARSAVEPISVIVSENRINQLSPLAGVKSLNRLEYILAKQEAVERGAQDVVLLNMNRNVAGASAANVFAAKAGTLLTPQLSDGALPGITRAAIIRLAQRAGLEVVQTSIRENEILEADEIFLSNSLIGIQPVSEIESHRLNDGVGALTAELIQLYMKLIEDFTVG